MKVLFFCSYYDPYLDSFYGTRPGLPEKSYNEQFQILGQDYFGTYISYYNHMRKMGDDAHLIIPNNEILQKTWAKENHVKYTEDNWIFEIPIAQVKSIKPDIFYISSMFGFFNDFLIEIRKHARKVVSWISCPIPNDVRLEYFDLIFTSMPEYVDMFEADGIRSALKEPCFDQDILMKLEKLKKPIPLSFIGSLGAHHQKRNASLRKLVDRTNIQMWGLGMTYLYYRALKKYQIANRWHNWKVRKRHHGEVWGIDMFNILHNSKITFNAHGEIAGNNAVNMRMYEATGVGTLLLTDGYNGEIKLFEDGKEAVYYRDVDDAVEKARYYLRHEEERKKIAKAGQARTLKQYNAVKSIEKFKHHVEKLL